MARNANLNLNSLGARPVEYVVHMYGDTRSVFHAGLDTDRFIVEWRLDGKGTGGTAEAGGVRAPGRAAAGLAGADEKGTPVVDLEWSTREQPLPTAPCVRVASPADIDALKATDLGRARVWQQMQRRAFNWYLANEYRVSGFEHHPEPGDSYYLVTRASE